MKKELIALDLVIALFTGIGGLNASASNIKLDGLEEENQTQEEKILADFELNQGL